MKERKIKEELAIAYKILSYMGLDDHTYTHLSSISSDGKTFYIYPFGMLFDEVNPENLLRVDFDGNVIEGSEFQYNITGYVIHGSIYKARSDIQSIFHIHTPEIVAVSACKDGLVPISQWALHFYGGISYHEYDSLNLDLGSGNKLIADLGAHYTMLMRNHGSITAGRTIQEALFYTFHLQQACKTQCLALAMNTELTMPNNETCLKTVKDLLGFEKDLGRRDWEAWVRRFR